ncbi:TPA: hypothetical protein N0F65_002463 [Lagenidium giganteum]|uniref:Uncharacterized protein n=1 Tax=Lagenidium giganteum TaxID=4803 RepID=A0AAV2YPF5_9STRA|nr:TPA: hypothetical protein N0F65_002463 [Lagenidium giganteum]
MDTLNGPSNGTSAQQKHTSPFAPTTTTTAAAHRPPSNEDCHARIQEQPLQRMTVQAHGTSCRLALTILTTLWSVVGAGMCTALTENVLTSDHCPGSCALDEHPCVVYAPTTAFPCQPSPLVGNCSVDDSYFDKSNRSQQCSLTYQCLPSLTTVSPANKLTEWVLIFRRESNYATVNATAIANLRFPANVTGIHLGGGPNDLPKGSFVPLVFYQKDVFSQVTRLQKLVLYHIDLSQAFETLLIPTSLELAFFIDANLDQVPLQLMTAPLFQLDLSLNNIKQFPARPTLWADSLTALNMSRNALQHFNVSFSKLEQLDLSFNPKLLGIPQVVFTMPKLRKLYLHGTNWTNVELTAQQFIFLRRLEEFTCGAPTDSVATCARQVRSIGRYSLCISLHCS